MNEYRCTRLVPYIGGIGEDNQAYREGYYIEAETPQEALEKMKRNFKSDDAEARKIGRRPFTCKFWKQLYVSSGVVAAP